MANQQASSDASSQRARLGAMSAVIGRGFWFRLSLGIGLVAAALLASSVSATYLTAEPSASDFSCPRYVPLAPTPGGSVHVVADQSQLAAALKLAEPGDTINLETGVYQELHFRQAFGHRSGRPTSPIVIQAAAGATPVIDGDNLNDPGKKAAVLIANVSDVAIRGLEVRDRFFGAMSWGSTSVLFEHNNIHSVGHSGVIANAYRESGPLVPSTNVTIRCNKIHNTGLLEPEFGEAVYIGSGIHDVADTTSNIVIEGNEIFDIANEAIDVKHHVTNVTIRHNRIHDIRPFYGGAISLGLNKHSWGPANYVVEDNEIWNIKSGLYYAQAIAVGHGPTTIRNNVIWNVETSPSQSWPWTAPIQLHGDDSGAEWAYGFGNANANQVTIANNTIVGCLRGCIDSTTDPGQITPRVVVDGNIVDQPSTGDATTDNDRLVTNGHFVGPTVGSADAGQGPGSGLRLRSGAEAESERTPSTTTSASVAPTTSQQNESVKAPSTTISVKAENAVPKPSTSTRLRPSTTEAAGGSTVAVRSGGDEGLDPTSNDSTTTRTPTTGPEREGTTPSITSPRQASATTIRVAANRSQVVDLRSSAGKADARAEQQHRIRRSVPGPRTNRRSRLIWRPTTTSPLPLEPGEGPTRSTTTVPTRQSPPTVRVG